MFKIKTPNPYYYGKTMDVGFKNGYGYTDNEEVKNILINDYGYELCEEEKPDQLKKESKKHKQSPKKEGD